MRLVLMVLGVGVVVTVVAFLVLYVALLIWAVFHPDILHSDCDWCNRLEAERRSVDTKTGQA